MTIQNPDMSRFQITTVFSLPVLRQGGILHGPLPLRGPDHLLHQRVDTQGSWSRSGSHVLPKNGKSTSAHCLAQCCSSGDFQFLFLFVGAFIVFVWSQFDGGKIDNRTIGLWFPSKSQEEAS